MEKRFKLTEINSGKEITGLVKKFPAIQIKNMSIHNSNMLGLLVYVNDIVGNYIVIKDYIITEDILKLIYNEKRTLILSLKLINDIYSDDSLYFNIKEITTRSKIKINNEWINVIGKNITKDANDEILTFSFDLSNGQIITETLYNLALKVKI